MARKTFESESEAWNVADGYTKLLVLFPLVECNEWEKIAIFGCKTMDENTILMPQYQMNALRIGGLKRLYETLRMVLENTEKLIKPKFQKDIKHLKNRLKKVGSKLPLCSQSTKNRQGKFTITIKEPIFESCLEVLRNIKTDVIEPINRSGMIFPEGHTYNLDDYKRKVINQGM